MRALTIGKDGLIYAAGSADKNKIFSYDPIFHTFDSKGGLGGCATVLDMICSVVASTGDKKMTTRATRYYTEG